MFRSILVATLAVVAVCATASDVLVATKENFEDIIAKDDLTLVKFYAPWCGHCKKMAPDFEKAATELKGKAQLVDLDATTEKELATKYGIRGFPTLKLFSKGEHISDYKGGRTKDALVQFIERSSLPSVVQCEDKESFDKFISENEGKSLVFGINLSELSPEFKKASMSVRDAMPDSIAFASVKDSSLLKDTVDVKELKDDSVILYRDDKTTDVFSGKAEDLESWIKSGSLPVFAELSRENAATYTETEKPVLIYFQDPDKKQEEHYNVIEEAAKELRGGSLVFTWINIVELKSFAEHIGVADKTPALAIYDFKSDAKYIFNQEFNKENLIKFVEGVSKGDVLPTMKSESVPETNDEPVKVVVGDSWSDIVQDFSKDVLIEQYAPWCGHCKKLEPVLTDLAKKLSGVETLVIAKMDATKNDAPADYKPKGYPTLHFFAAGSKTGVAYEGGREVDDFIKYLKENATHKEGIEVPSEDSEDSEESQEEDEKSEL